MKVCFVGLGSIGKRHIKNLSNICKDKSLELEIHALRTGFGKLENEIEELLYKVVYSYDELDDTYDACFITNPTFLHYETLDILKNRSKHFFIEKPIFNKLNLNIEKFLNDGNIYYVACPLRYTEIIRATNKIVTNEKTISVRAITSSFLPEWRKDTDYRKVYSADKDKGGGVILDLIHEWDYLTYIFGYPDNVKMLYGKYSDLDINSEDIAIYIASYPDMLMELHLDYFGRVTRRNLEIRTNMHEYVCDIAYGKIYCDNVLSEEFSELPNDKYIREMETFLDIVINNQESENNIVHAIKTMKIANAITE